MWCDDFGVSPPPPGFQWPPGWWNIFRLGDPELNLHLSHCYWEGAKPEIWHYFIRPLKGNDWDKFFFVFFGGACWDVILSTNIKPISQPRLKEINSRPPKKMRKKWWQAFFLCVFSFLNQLWYTFVPPQKKKTCPLTLPTTIFQGTC